MYKHYPYRIVCIDYCKSTNPNNIYANRDVEFYLADVADQHAVDVIFQIEKPDYVIHLAAESFVDTSIKDAVPFIHSNVLGTQVMVDASIKHKVKRFIYCGTDEVLGSLKSEDEEGWDETAPLNPKNPYSASKAAGEMIVRAAASTHQLPYCITRCCNVFGPRQSMRNFIPKVIKGITEGTEVGVYGQGAEIREWIYVEDACDAIMKVLEAGKGNETYHIGTGFELSNLEMFQKIATTMGKGYELIKFIENRKGHDFRYSLKNNKIKALGWEPQSKLKDGLVACCSWYIGNRWFMAPNT